MPNENSHIGLGISSVAERMRKYRRGRRRELRYAQVLIGPLELDGLTAKGYLRAGDRGNIRAIEAAINNLMFDCFKHTGYL
jgi:hypothetical protein